MTTTPPPTGTWVRARHASGSQHALTAREPGCNCALRWLRFTALPPVPCSRLPAEVDSVFDDDAALSDEGKKSIFNLLVGGQPGLSGQRMRVAHTWGFLHDQQAPSLLIRGRPLVCWRWQ